MADLLRFVLELATDAAARDAFRDDPTGVLETAVDGAGGLTGEDVEAAAEWARERVGRSPADRLRIAGPVVPIGDETPLDAARRVLCGLCDEMDGPPAEVIALGTGHGAPVPPAPPSPEVATGGGEPVALQPPSLRGRHLWAIGDPEDGESPPVDQDHPVLGGTPPLRPVTDPDEP